MRVCLETRAAWNIMGQYSQTCIYFKKETFLPNNNVSIAT